MPKKEERERKKLVVEEVEAPVSESVVSSTELEKEEAHPEPVINEEAASTEAAVEVKEEKEEMAKEIHEEESHLHDIHTGNVPEGLEKKGNPIWWILIPGIFLLGALLGGIVFYIKGVNSAVIPTPSPSPAPVSTETPSPSPISKADLAKFSIKIENGSGIPGAAGAAKDILVKAGFSISSTGNANTYDFTDTIIEAKADVPQAFISQLTITLQSSYSIGKNVTLSDSSTDEVIVIIGSSKAQ